MTGDETRDAAFWAELRDWRRDFHAHPEFGFEEHRTGRLVAERLRRFGITDIAEGVGGTGVVASLRRGTGDRCIALRADMDALRIAEQAGPAHASTHPGVMHACGHDGHTTMLLGAARILAAEGGFDGTVRFIFQPAEEWGRGALAMLADGLAERFPFDEIYGLHNWPGLPVGSFRTRAGAVMSAEDNFEIVLRGVGGHASQPQRGREVLVAACALVVNLQTVISRRVAPTEAAVLSVTELLTDGTRNALPGTARILGDARSFRPEISATIEAELRRIAAGTAASYGVECQVAYSREFIPTINDPGATLAALAAARAVLGSERVGEMAEPNTGSEDFARFLQHAPGCFAFIGNGEASKPLHHPEYDFDDSALRGGTEFLVRIARDRLPPRGS
ncbi:M20 aminoacylase family protein [Pseudoroseomonas cervicalis]|uniref:M20 aminoacylase family protein n=1 Tax=Teichococcus cervicalis TaxID=204525 RepID=UPI00278A7E1B|nr:M20 aminoacylase family protein [Pseudoroseomonas cervicalis]MDQ1079437.1 amidohydrolase [Pseudoroseomonas cervicalis]